MLSKRRRRRSRSTPRRYQRRLTSGRSPRGRSTRQRLREPCLTTLPDLPPGLPTVPPSVPLIGPTTMLPPAPSGAAPAVPGVSGVPGVPGCRGSRGAGRSPGCRPGEPEVTAGSQPVLDLGGVAVDLSAPAGPPGGASPAGPPSGASLPGTPGGSTPPPPAGLDVLEFRPVLEPRPGEPRPFDANLLRE